MDDFGNTIHWYDTVRGHHSLGLYGYAEGFGIIEVLMQAVDYNDLRS